MPREIEREIETSEIREKNIEKLRNFLEILAERMRKEGVPVTKDCRIDMDAFGDVYSPETLDRDKKRVDELETEWVAKEKIPKEKLREKGDSLEMLKTAIFNKFLGSEYIAVRTSLYDDYTNHVDNIILEKETGNLVCALDETGENRGKTYEDKKERVLRRNVEGEGVSLKYGLKLEGNELKPGKIEKAPILYLVLPPRYIEEGIKNLTPSLEEKSDYEKNLFRYFVKSLDYQVGQLKLEPKLTTSLKESVEQFEKTLEKFK